MFTLLNRPSVYGFAVFNRVYAEVQPEEQKALYDDIIEHKETAMLKQYIKDLGRVEGRVEGRQVMLQRQLNKRFGQNILDLQFQERLQKATPEQLDLWAEKLLDAKNIDEVFKDN